MNNYLLDFLSLVYPRCCVCCNQLLNTSEKYVCLDCWSDLPYTHYVKVEKNPVEMVFEGRINYKAAASFFHFRKGNKCQQLLHELKYRNNPDLGIYLGQWIGAELVKSERFRGIDALTPIPLHRNKLKKRGYNQSECLAKGIASVLNVKVCTNLVQKRHHGSSQTNKNRLERWDNVANSFRFNKRPDWEINHLLVVDDVITTGATIESFVSKIAPVVKTEISILSLAHTD